MRPRPDIDPAAARAYPPPHCPVRQIPTVAISDKTGRTFKHVKVTYRLDWVAGLSEKAKRDRFRAGSGAGRRESEPVRGPVDGLEKGEPLGVCGGTYCGRGRDRGSARRVESARRGQPLCGQLPPAAAAAERHGSAGGGKPSGKSAPAAAALRATRATNGGKLLDRPLETAAAAGRLRRATRRRGRLPATSMDPPLGFAGRTSVLPSVTQGDSDFGVPVEDRCQRPGIPRLGPLRPGATRASSTTRTKVGNIWNPYKQNVLKGDYPVIGQKHLPQHHRHQPPGDRRPAWIPTSEHATSTARPVRILTDFFGSPNHLNYQHYLSVQVDLFSGDAGFKPSDWRVVVTPTFNVNTLNVDEVGVVTPNPTDGTTRDRTLFLARGILHRDEDRGYQPVLRFRLDAGRLAVLQQRLPRLSVRRHQQGRPPVRHQLLQPRPVQHRLLPPVREGHRLRPQHVPGPRAGRGGRQLLPAGLHLPRLHRGSQLPLRPRRPDHPLRQPGLPGAARPGRQRPAAHHRRLLPRPRRQRPHRPLQHHEPVLLCVRPRHEQRVGRAGARHQRLDGGGGTVLRPRLEALPVSGFYSSGDHNTQNHEAHGFDTILDDVDFAGGEFSYWATTRSSLSASTSSRKTAWCPTCARARRRGRPTSSTPA